MLEIKSIKKVKKQPVYDIEVANHGSNYILENNVVSSNSGLKYAADIILTLSKSQEKDGTVHKGVNILCTAYKSRLTKEKTQTRVKLLFEEGLQKYSGLLEIAELAGIFEKVGNKYKVPTEGKDATYFGKAINNKPEEFFTPDVLDMIDEWTKVNFKYGSGTNHEATEE